MAQFNASSIRSQMARAQQQARQQTRASMQREADKIANTLPPEMRSQFRREISKLKSQI